jgi:hypothetical protein
MNQIDFLDEFALLNNNGLAMSSGFSLFSLCACIQRRGPVGWECAAPLDP